MKVSGILTKRVAALLFIFCFIIFFRPVVAMAEPSPSPTATPSDVPDNLEALPEDLLPGWEVYCMHNGVNLRESPSGDVLAVLRRNDRLIFLNWADADADWAHVQFGDIAGYCSAKFLAYDPDAAPTPTPTATPVPSPTPTATPTPSPTPSPEPTATDKQAPPASKTDYISSWEESDVGTKLSSIPVWLFGVVALALLAIVVYKFIVSHRQ